MANYLYLLLAGTLTATALFGQHAQASGIEVAADVDVAIVFAVDFSSSIDPHTADFQRNGHSTALTSPEIAAAIARNQRGCIAVSYFEWSSPGQIRKVLPWTTICGPKDAEAAAEVIDRKGDTGFRRRGRGGTSVSTAIDVGSVFLDEFPGRAARKVIDISSNGENNDGVPVRRSRLAALAKGYTINAIAIPPTRKTSGRELASYFADHVIGGPQAFVVTPSGPGDYARALRLKLVTEISMNGSPSFSPGTPASTSVARGQ
ncbi:MAG: DUF1194 domain-containing protein [Mesorhizobium sp.]